MAILQDRFHRVTWMRYTRSPWNNRQRSALGFAGAPSAAPKWARHMSNVRLSCRSRSGLLTGVALGVLTLFPIADGQVAQAQAQVSVSIGFRDALEPYGRWQRHSRWGEVWVPARRTQNWRPYQTGHWVYTDEWGWYWISNDDEVEWGWVTYHYGRWINDASYGWAWIPGEEWGPAWVDWRRGDDFVGWAPLAPDEIIVETRDDPQFWVFVRPRDLVAPRAYVVFLPPQQRTIYFQRTVIVNSTIVIDNRGQRIAVNPGIPPAYIAAASQRPLPTYQVRPRVFAGTRGVEGAVEIRAEDLRGRGGPGSRDRDRSRTSEVAVQRTSTVIQPAASVPAPEPLGRGEKGRLGSTPPRAAQGASQPTLPTTQGQPLAAPAQQGQPAATPGATQPPASTPGAIPPPASAPGTTTFPPPTPGTIAPPSPTPGARTPPASTPGAATPADTRPTQPSGERPATPTGERPATLPTPPPLQSAPRTEPLRPTTPQSVPAEKTPPPKAAPEAPRGERQMTPPPAQSAPRIEQPSRPVTPPPAQSAPRIEQPSRPVTPPPAQSAPRIEQPSRPATPPPAQTAPAQQSPPAATSAPPPKSTVPVQREKSE
jgi:hypothetical protein